MVGWHHLLDGQEFEQAPGVGDGQKPGVLQSMGSQSETQLSDFTMAMARQHIKIQRHYFVDKGPSSQSYGFSSSHVWM